MALLRRIVPPEGIRSASALPLARNCCSHSSTFLEKPVFMVFISSKLSETATPRAASPSRINSANNPGKCRGWGESGTGPDGLLEVSQGNGLAICEVIALFTYIGQLKQTLYLLLRQFFL